MKRALLIIVIACLVAPAVAYAATVVCHGGTCKGTDQNDQMFGSAEHDVIYAKAGNDQINAALPQICIPGVGCQGFRDRDEIHAGSGNDTINVVDQGASDKVFPDTVYCGSGDDTVTANDGDKLFGCEHITRVPLS